MVVVFSESSMKCNQTSKKVSCFNFTQWNHSLTVQAFLPITFCEMAAKRTSPMYKLEYHKGGSFIEITFAWFLGWSQFTEYEWDDMT